MRSCSCVCTEWNEFISYDRQLKSKRDVLDPYEPINTRCYIGTNYCGNVEFDKPIGVCVSSGRIIVCDHRIQILDQNGESIHRFGSRGSKVGEFKAPYRICSIGENLWITDYFNKRIQVFNSTTYSPDFIIPLDDFPRGVCSTTKGLVVVATDRGDIFTLDQRGNIIRRLDYCRQYDHQFNWLRGVCCNSRDEILILNDLNHRVQIFSESGKFLRTFGSYGTHQNEFRNPHGICTDAKDNIFVADRDNNRVSIFDSEGQFIQKICVSSPTDVCLMGKRMIVTSNDNFVAVFSN